MQTQMTVMRQLEDYHRVSAKGVRLFIVKWSDGLNRSAKLQAFSSCKVNLTSGKMLCADIIA